MPNVSEYDDQDTWMAACMPKMMEEGKEHDQASAACMSMWREKKSYDAMTLEEAVKVGARNSRRDQQRLQMMHDYSVENGAICKGGKALQPEEISVVFGSQVKALEGGKVAGYLVRYGNPNDRDLTGDYFAPDTDFGEVDKSIVLYNHGLDKTVRRRKIGEGKLTPDEVGIWIEAQLNMRDEYEKAIYEMAAQGKLGWSSGTAGHLVERDGEGKILSWFLGLDASLTPTPAEFRNVVTLKSLITSEANASGAKPIPKDKGDNLQETNIMEKEEIKALFDAQKSDIAELVKNEAASAATKAVTDALEKLPEVKAVMNGEVKVTKAAEDQPFEKPGHFFMAVKNAAVNPWQIDPRLKSLIAPKEEAKATGLSEAQPSQAGFLVPQQTAAGILEKMYNTGTLLGQMSNRDPVTGNNMTYNIVDETSRADGSRNGGITGYWGAEGGTKTASKPTFRQLELKLKKVYALCVATDELLEDAPALESWLTRTVPSELRFKVEDAIFNGDGVGKPFGILSSPAFKSAVRTDANEIDAYDIGRMWAARYIGVNDYIWLGNQSIFSQLLNLVVGTTPVFLPAGGIGGLPYATLLGRPYFDIEYAPALGTLGDLTLVSPSQYQMIEKAGGIQSASSIHVYFTTDESAFRFVYRVDGAPTWRTTLTLKDSNTVSPFVGLAATT